MYVVIGSVIAAFGRPCSTHAPPKVSLNWFLPNNRPIISSILLICAPLGYIAGYAITTFLVTADETDDHETVKDQIYNLIFYENIGTSVCIILTMILYKDKPPTPPSFAADKEEVKYSVGK
jgi:FLVCR family feline leukemia virus subgroup C receptor-related protein